MWIPAHTAYIYMHVKSLHCMYTDDHVTLQPDTQSRDTRDGTSPDLTMSRDLTPSQGNQSSPL